MKFKTIDEERATFLRRTAARCKIARPSRAHRFLVRTPAGEEVLRNPVLAVGAIEPRLPPALRDTVMQNPKYRGWKLNPSKIRWRPRRVRREVPVILS